MPRGVLNSAVNKLEEILRVAKSMETKDLGISTVEAVFPVLGDGGSSIVKIAADRL
jgi:hypothetical protein